MSNYWDHMLEPMDDYEKRYSENLVMKLTGYTREEAKKLLGH